MILCFNTHNRDHHASIFNTVTTNNYSTWENIYSEAISRHGRNQNIYQTKYQFINRHESVLDTIQYNMNKLFCIYHQNIYITNVVLNLLNSFAFVILQGSANNFK